MIRIASLLIVIAYSANAGILVDSCAFDDAACIKRADQMREESHDRLMELQRDRLNQRPQAIPNTQNAITDRVDAIRKLPPVQQNMRPTVQSDK